MTPPPDAAQRPHTHSLFGTDRPDPYHWLRDRDDPDVLAYLAAENAYAAAMTAPTQALEDAIYGEIVARVVPDDASAPVFDRGFWVYRRFEDGKEYPVYARRSGTMDAREEILIDGNARADGQGYYHLGAAAVADDGQTLAFAEDTTGRRIYTVRFKNLATGEILPDEIHPATPALAWAADSRTLFVTRQDAETLRSHQVTRHTLGQDGETVVFQDDDDTFNVGVGRSKDRRFVVVASEQTLTSEYLFLDANDPTGDFRTIRPRERGVEYSADHAGDRWTILTNGGGAENFRLVTAPTDAPDAWTEIVPTRPDVLIETFDVFTDALVTQEREGGLVRLRVRTPDGALVSDVAFDETAYAAELAATPEAGSPTFRYTYESLTTPPQTVDVSFDGGARTVVKEQDVPTYDASRYTTERRWITARDGAHVPVSLVRAAATPLDGTAPLLLYGYGSYGLSMDAHFRVSLPSLLDRGFVYAIAHIRGGQEMGRAWYEAGKLGHKMNTFTDFIDTAEALVADGVADPDRVYAQGGSAGGLLVGAVANLRPDLWAGIVAQVPFVDVVTTMLDDSIPLTTGEYDEWGNPNEEPAFRTMLAYSPLDNVHAADYPAMLVMTGLHDSQVQYWEPAKWVAKLRDLNTGSAPILFKTEMEAGHGGPSGRYRAYREVAFVTAWLLAQAGLAE